MTISADPQPQRQHHNFRQVQSSAGPPLTHLQLSPQIVTALTAKNVGSLDELIRFAESGDFAQFRYRSELISALAAYVANTSSNQTDWRGYWKQRGSIFHFLSADLPELRSLNTCSAEQPINRDTFGSAGAMLERAGYSTLGLLAEGLQLGIVDVRGIGPGKVQQFFERLVEVIDIIRDTGSILLTDEIRQSDPFDEAMLTDLSCEIRRLSIGVLHLGSKSRWLRETGLLTIGQIADAWPIEYGDIRGLGHTTIKVLTNRLNALISSLSPVGKIEWDEYCRKCNIKLVPASSAPVNGSEFLAKLGQTLTEIADSLPDKVYAEILRSRLSRMPGDQKTLDEIARTTDPPITRERVRQKEKKLLRQLPDGLIWDSYSGLDIHFRPDFAQWWRIAASRFQDTDEIEFEEFVAELSKAWDVDIPSLTRQLPIILAIVTGESGMSPGFRSAINLDPVYYGEISDEFMLLPVTRLRLDKHALRLKADGINRIGDFIQIYRSGEIEWRENSSIRQTTEHLNGIAECLDANNNIHWPSYRMRLGLEQLPHKVTENAAAFTAELPVVITKLLECCQFTGRSVDIFKLRTSQNRKNRLTLAQTADILNTFGPSIKREETFFLQRLNDIIIGREYTLLSVWLEESWIRYWREAEAIYNMNVTHFSVFRTRLLERWGLRKADRAIAIMWSIMSGYPNGRPVRKKKVVVDIQDSTPVSRITLRGFRRFH